MTRMSLIAGTILGVLMSVQSSSAAEVKVLTAGAFKQVVLAVVPEFEKQTGHKVTVDNDTVGGLTKKIEGGETFDVVVLTPAAVDELTKKGKIAEGTKSVLAALAGSVPDNVYNKDVIPRWKERFGGLGVISP